MELNWIEFFIRAQKKNINIIRKKVQVVILTENNDQKLQHAGKGVGRSRKLIPTFTFTSHFICISFQSSSKCINTRYYMQLVHYYNFMTIILQHYVNVYYILYPIHLFISAVLLLRLLLYRLSLSSWFNCSPVQRCSLSLFCNSHITETKKDWPCHCLTVNVLEATPRYITQSFTAAL